MASAEAKDGEEVMGEGREGDPVDKIRRLLRIAIYNIGYVEGFFPDAYFSDIVVREDDSESRRLMNLIDEAEACLCDALKKKYLKTLVFSICEKYEGPVLQEFIFSFSYPSTGPDEVVMMMTRTGSKVITKFEASAVKVTPNQMRSSACKMIRLIVQQTRTYPVQEEHAIEMKLSFYEDTTPEDYEPPFPKYCVNSEDVAIWNNNILKMEVGNINNKHVVLTLKVKSAQSYCKNSIVDDCSDYEMCECETYGYTSAPNDDTEEDYHTGMLASPIKAWYPQDTGTQMTRKRKTGFVLVSSSKKIKFLLDSGASHHICNDKAIMRNLKDVKKEYQVSLASCGGLELKAEMMGTVVTKDMKLSQVGYIPEMEFNVVSIGQLAVQGLITTGGDGRFSVIDAKEARVVGEGHLQRKTEKVDGRVYHEYVFKSLIREIEGDDEKLIEPLRADDDEIDEEEEKKCWVIDTGCGRHMIPDISILTQVKREEVTFQAACGIVSSTHKGLVKEGNLILRDVLCCPKVTRKMISGPMLDLSGHRFTFNDKKCCIVHKDGLELRGVGKLDRATRTYLLKPGEDSRAAAAAKEEPKMLAAAAEGYGGPKQEADTKNMRGKGKKTAQATKRLRLS
ncbi:uncharacterized protein [Oryza sativa Japonica Group]|uniref:uncharacterized protein isoform X2 n=1 Tax=Oryza sativa subsp. japonica TaxID=39947 RepID=UPI002643AAE6|nr:hypothetical protein DAI22_12g204600 [Oryza sativa Japonica Group]